MRSVLVVLSLALAACGDNAQVAGDAMPPDAPPDSAPVYPACAEFAGSTSSVPAHVMSAVAGADVEAPACATTDAPYGAESKGPDRVVPIGGLRPGTSYVVKLVSSSDLAFYVTTGCSTARGPAPDQCLLFQDSSLGGTELGRFVATSAIAYVIVDFYASHPPLSTGFTLDVYEEQCTTDAQCSGATPACADGVCVECATSFHCGTSAKPRCEPTTKLCTAGIDTCDSDDAADPADDGPAGARVLVVNGASVTSATGSVCASPRSEADFFAFDVTALGQTWDLSLAWPTTDDLDLELFDATGRTLGLSYFERPEHVRLTYLPVGRYYARVHEFSGDATPVAYTLDVQRTAGAGCTSAADCASEFRNQIYRGSCSAGACVSIDGAGAVVEGGACDSQSDCAPSLSCPSFFFVADADERETCARGCTNDGECAALGPDFVCTTYLASNFCVRKCTSDEQCPTSIDDTPLTPPWFRFSCNVSTGRCAP